MQAQAKIGQHKAVQSAKETKTKLEELVRKSIKGNVEATGALCQKIAKDVLFRTEYILRNRMDAEDAAQEVLIRVCENICSLRDPKVFGVWLDRIIVNESRRFMMKNYKQGDNVVNIQEYLDAIREDNADYLPHDSADRKESRKVVMGIIDKLPERQRQVLLLCFYGERSVTEAAGILGITRSSASHSLSSAKKRVKRELEKLAGKSDYMLHGLSMLPGSTLLKNILREEGANYTPADIMWVENAVSRCYEVIGDPAVVGAAGSAGAACAAAAGTKGSTGAAGTAANSSIFAPIIAVAAAAAVAIAGFVNYPVTEVPPEAVVVVANVEYAVVFTGGDAQAEHLNPAGAMAQTSSSHGELKALEWKITPAGHEAALYSGKGGRVDEAFSDMIKTGMDGDYVIYFLMEDAAGGTYLLSREFIIKTK